MKGTTLQVDRKSRPHRIVLAHLQGNAVSIGHRQGSFDRLFRPCGKDHSKPFFVLTTLICHGCPTNA